MSAHGAKQTLAANGLADYLAPEAIQRWGNAMSLTDLASIGSLVSGGAVLISLIYLSLQVRQTERNQRAAVNQGMIDRMVQLQARVCGEPLASLHLRALQGDVVFSEPEIAQILSFLQQLLSHALDAWVQRRANLVDAPTFETIVAPARLAFSIRAYRSCWQMSEWSLQSEFRTFIEAELLNVAILPPLDIRGQFEAGLAQISRQLAPGA